MPNYGYHLALAEGRLVRRIYGALLPLIVRRTIRPPRSLAFEVFSYSGETALPEQVASIRSFLKHAGRPRRFTVVSDGTYSAASIDLLRRLDASVVVSPLPDVSPDLPATFRAYLTAHPTGKQLAMTMTLPHDGPALYVDSDVLFFPQAHGLAQMAETTDVSAFYLGDCQFSGDERLLRTPDEQAQPVNSGVLFLFRPLDWSLGQERFSELSGPPNFFTNQTLTHLAMHANNALPLEAAKYVLQLDDQTLYGDQYAGAGIALRHYVNPVRHKFWTTLWRP